MHNYNKNIESILYESGLTAQGCWDSFDSYDREAIIRAFYMIIKECAIIADGLDPLQDGGVGKEIKRWFE